MVLRTYTFGVRFRKGFKKEMLAKQAGIGGDPARVRPNKTECLWVQEAVART